MKVVLQEVTSARVVIDQKVHSEIGKGYLLLVSFTNGDNESICTKVATKISKLRIFLDSNGKTNLSIFDVGGEILSVSQFTIYADIKSGNRPSYTSCMAPGEATKLYDFFNNELRKLNLRVSEGVFGADMKVELVNDGPYTLVIDSEDIK